MIYKFANALDTIEPAAGTEEQTSMPKVLAVPYAMHTATIRTKMMNFISIMAC